MAAKLSAFCCLYWNGYFLSQVEEKRQLVNLFFFFPWRFLLVKTFSVKSIDWLIRWVPQKILVFKLKKNQIPRNMQSYANQHNLLHHHYIQDYSCSLHLTNIWGGFISLKSKTWEKVPIAGKAKKKKQKEKRKEKKKSLFPLFSLKFSLGKQTQNLCQWCQEQSPPLTNSRQCFL